jgi:hypothetical protein
MILNLLHDKSTVAPGAAELGTVVSEIVAVAENMWRN